MSNYNSGAYNTEVAPKTVWVSNRHKYLVAVVQESSVPTEVRYTIQSTYVNNGIVKQVPIDRFLKRFEPTTESTVEAGSVWSCLASNKLSAVVNSVDGDEVSFTFNNEITGQEQKRKSPLKVFRAAYTEGLSSSDLDVDEEENKARIRKSTEQAIEQLEGLKEHYELGYNGGFEKGYNKGCEETLEMCVDKEVGVIPIKIANKTKSNSKSSDKSSIAVSNSIIKDDSIINNTNTKEEQTYKSKYTMDSNSGTGKTGEYKLIGIHGLAHSGKEKITNLNKTDLRKSYNEGHSYGYDQTRVKITGLNKEELRNAYIDGYNNGVWDTVSEFELGNAFTQNLHEESYHKGLEEGKRISEVERVNIIKGGELEVGSTWVGNINSNFVATVKLLTGEKVVVDIINTKNNSKREHEFYISYFKNAYSPLKKGSKSKNDFDDSTVKLNNTYGNVQWFFDNNEDFLEDFLSISKPDEKGSKEHKYPHYFKDVSKLDFVDVYMVCKLFEVNDSSHCTQHSIKKLLLSGKRGTKDRLKDITEARDTLNRLLEIENNNVN